MAIGLTTGCAARINPREALAAMQSRAPEGSPKLLAIYQPWFGQKEHIDVGYSCHDPNVLRQQIAKAKELNISGFVVNWYGPRKEFEDKAFALMGRLPMPVPALKWPRNRRSGGPSGVRHGRGDRGPAIIYDRYISPQAGEARNAYLRYNGRPVISIFPRIQTLTGTGYGR